jgi:ribosomal protein S27AE
MKEDTALIVHNGKTIAERVQKCSHCGESVVSADEYERVRKELHPSIFGRIKSIIKGDVQFVELSKGKIL